MIMVPAILVGAFLVFALGYQLTNGAITAIDSLKQRIWKSGSSTDDTKGCSIIGGVFTVIVMIILTVALPSQARYLVWYLLIFLGIIGGLLSFAQSGSTPNARNGIKEEDNSHQPGGKQKQHPNPNCCYTWRTNTSSSSSHNNIPRQQTTRDSMYQELLIKTKYNGDLTDRLIEYERQHKPGASNVELIMSAIEHWERDNK